MRRERPLYISICVMLFGVRSAKSWGDMAWPGAIVREYTRTCTHKTYILSNVMDPECYFKSTPNKQCKLTKHHLL